MSSTLLRLGKNTSQNPKVRPQKNSFERRHKSICNVSFWFMKSKQTFNTHTHSNDCVYLVDYEDFCRTVATAYSACDKRHLFTMRISGASLAGKTIWRHKNVDLCGILTNINYSTIYTCAARHKKNRAARAKRKTAAWPFVKLLYDSCRLSLRTCVLCRRHQCKFNCDLFCCFDDELDRGRISVLLQRSLLTLLWAQTITCLLCRCC